MAQAVSKKQKRYDDTSTILDFLPILQWRLMKFTFIVILLSAIVVASSALGGGVEGQAAVAEGNDADKSTSTNLQLQQHQQQRDLLSSWCPSSTPVLWHRDLTKTWSMERGDVYQRCRL